MADPEIGGDVDQTIERRLHLRDRGRSQQEQRRAATQGGRERRVVEKVQADRFDLGKPLGDRFDAEVSTADRNARSLERHDRRRSNVAEGTGYEYRTVNHYPPLTRPFRTDLLGLFYRTQWQRSSHRRTTGRLVPMLADIDQTKETHE